MALREPSPLEPCSFWPINLQDERGCLLCPLLQCKYDTKERPQTIMAQSLLAQGLPAAEAARQSGLSKRTVQRMRIRGGDR